MQTPFKFEQNKRERLVKKGVLPTTITGYPYFLNNDQQSTPSFPHLFTAIGEHFSVYRSLGLDPKAARKWISDQLASDMKFISNTSPQLSDAILNHARVNNHLPGSSYFYLDENHKLFYCIITRSDNPEQPICLGMELDLNQAPYQLLEKLILKLSPERREPIRFRYLDCELARKKIRDSILPMLTVGFVLIGSTASQTREMEQALNTLEELEKIQPADEILTEQFYDQSKISDIFDETIIAAKYGQMFNSLAQKMQDNLHQLFIINPYEMGRAIVNAKIGSFFYHLFGMIHALLSIPVDLAVEVTALVTRSVKQVGISGYGRLFSSEERTAPSKEATQQKHIPVV
jgi:hypothetical protein